MERIARERPSARVYGTHRPSVSESARDRVCPRARETECGER